MIMHLRLPCITAEIRCFGVKLVLHMPCPATALLQAQGLESLFRLAAVLTYPMSCG